MKKALAVFTATGALTLAALAGTVGTANAAAASQVRYGPFPTPGICEQFVWDNGEWGIWDCENYGDGWYAYA